MATIRKRSWRTAAGETKIAWTVDVTDLAGNRQRKQFATRAQANDFRIEVEGDIRVGKFRYEAGKVTVRELARHFLKHCEGRVDRKERMTRHTLEMYEGHIWNYLCPDPARHKGKHRHRRLVAFTQGIGDLKLAQLNARAVGDLRDRLREAGVTVQTTRKVIGSLKAILQFAVSRDLIAVNVAKGVAVIGRRDEGAKKVVPPSKEAMRQLLAVADPDFKVKLMFAAATGLRAGEMHALRWHHLDLERGEVKVETRVDAHHEEDVTKTAAGMRNVPLAAPLVLALKEWKLRTKRKKPADLVFPSKRGWYVGHDNMVKRKFLPLFDKLAALHAADPANHPEPPARFNWHALRHFAVSCWIEVGPSPKTVQTIAGHSTLAVTMDRYGHLLKSDDHRKAMEAIAGEVFSA